MPTPYEIWLWRQNLKYGDRFGTPYARGQFQPTPLKAQNWWQQLTPWKEEQGETFGQVWQKPFKAFGATLTAPFTPSVPGTQGMPWLQREEAEYEQWEEPTWTMPWGGKFRPTKGLVESVPWFAAGGVAGKGIGALAGLAGKAGAKGAAARLGQAALTPLGGSAKGVFQAAGKAGGISGRAAQVISAPMAGVEAATGLIGRGIGKGVGLLTKPKAFPDLRPIDLVVDISTRPDEMRRLANLPMINKIAKYINPSGVAKTPIEKARVASGVYENEGAVKALSVISALDALGRSAKVFGVDDLGKIKAGSLQGVYLHDIATYPNKYMTKLNSQQQHWIKQAISIEDEIKPFFKANGIDINELAFDEGGRWASRRVVGKRAADGETLMVGFISSGPGRKWGSKTAMEKTRVFKDIAEATEAGFEYLDWEDALRFNVQSAYKRVADKRVADWLLPQIPHRTTAAPHELKIDAAIAKINLNKAKRLQLAINRAIRGEKLPEATLKSFDNLGVGLREAMGDTTALRELKPAVKEVFKKAQTEFHLAEGVRARARERAMRTTFEEATVKAPAFAGKILTGPEAKATAKALNDFFTPEVSQALLAVNKVNAVSRMMALAGDASIAGIQLIFLPFTNPKAFTDSMKGFVKAMFNPTFQANQLAKHSDLIARHPDIVLSFRGATEMTEAMARGGWLSPNIKLLPQGENWLKSMGLLAPRTVGKTAGTILRPFQRGYEGALDTAGLKLLESMEHLATTPAQTAELDAFINEFRGLFSQSRLGMSLTQKQVERAGVLAPQYTRAIGSLLVDAVRGTFGKGELRGKLARDSLAKGIVGMMALSTAVSMMKGESIDEAVDHLNPMSNNFMTWDVAGQRVGPGSKVRSILRLIGQIGDDPSNLVDEISMRNPGLRFLRGNLAPVGGTAIDLLTGRNFIGDPTRDGMLNLTKTVIGENMVPIWLQSLAYEGGSVEQRMLRGAVEFVGGRAYPQLPPLTPEQIQWRAYRGIEDKIWANYPREMRKINDEITKLESEDPIKARKSLFQYPMIVMARILIAQEKKRWKAIHRSA